MKSKHIAGVASGPLLCWRMEVERSSIIKHTACLIVNRMAQPNRWAICFSGALRAPPPKA